MADQFDEVISELEAELLSEEPLAEETAQPEEKNPLVELFLSKTIRVVGTVKDPLFCAADVAAHIGDKHYRQTLTAYSRVETSKTGAYVHKIETKDKGGDMKPMWYLTEGGLYRYLLRSNREEASDFQSYVYDILRIERDRVVDARELANKIQKETFVLKINDLNARLEESNTRHCIARSDADRAMRIANGLRADLKRSTNQAAKKESSAFAKDIARLRALEEANRTRGPFESAHQF